MYKAKCKIPKWNKTANPNCPYFTDDKSVNYLNARWPENMPTVSFRSSGIKYKVNLNASLAIRNKLESVHMSDNIVYSLDHFFMPLPYLKHLNISNNFITYISNHFFKVCQNLETLTLSYNLLGSVLATDTNGLIFKPLKQLKNLDLSDNNIAVLPKDLFKYTRNVAVLNLSHNHLAEFSLEIDHMKKLAKLDLQSNRINTISVKVLDKIKTVSQEENRDISIDLTNNTLSVSCENIQFLSWLTENPDYFISIDKYIFRENDNINVILHYDEMLELLPTLRKRCISYTALIAVSSIVILAFIVLVASGVLYRYRWRLKYMYYMARARYHKYEHLPENDPEQEYTYDAFISCANADVRFVRYEILPKLEDEFGLKLCVHARDFLPGNYIAENILEAILKSRKTVVILSENFLKSKWCQYEFHMARMEGIFSRGGQSVLFVLIYEEVDTRKLSLEMLECIQGETYAQYPDDETERPYFWDTIQRALKWYLSSYLIIRRASKRKLPTSVKGRNVTRQWMEP